MLQLLLIRQKRFVKRFCDAFLSLFLKGLYLSSDIGIKKSKQELKETEISWLRNVLTTSSFLANKYILQDCLGINIFLLGGAPSPPRDLEKLVDYIYRFFPELHRSLFNLKH